MSDMIRPSWVQRRGMVLVGALIYLHLQESTLTRTR